MLKTNVIKQTWRMVCRTPQGIQTLTVKAESPAAAEAALPEDWQLVEVEKA